MVASMTAFATREAELEGGQLAWELRSVNHRYLEIQPRLPELLRALEPEVRERVGAVLGRGRVECVLRYSPAADAAGVEVDEPLLRSLVEACRTVGRHLDEAAPPSAADLLRWPGLVRQAGPDREALRAPALELLEATLGDLAATRSGEGERLKALLLERCTRIDELVAAESRGVAEINERLRLRLHQRLAELAGEVDPGRLEQEVVYLAQRLDVSEELERLATHVAAVRAALEAAEPVGRRLDFLMQELNREANTLGSKAADAGRSQASVELKVLIEQMREQVQNLE